MRWTWLVLGTAALLAAPAAAFEFPRPATLVFESSDTMGRYALPVGPVTAEGLNLTFKNGQVLRRAWQIPDTDLTAAQVFAALRDQFAALDLNTIFDCQDQGCGGFDFRFGIEVISTPDMFVDLGDYHFASFTATDGADAASLLVSKGAQTVYVQIIEVRAADADPLVQPRLPDAGPGPSGLLASDLGVAQKLAQSGAAVLDDLEFASGAVALTDARFASLEQLAAFLTQTEGARVVLVGHTDATGSLEQNLSLSLQRAEAVVDRLVRNLGVSPDQVRAEGIGFLAPRATNVTEAGRRANRRVEAVLIAPLN